MAVVPAQIGGTVATSTVQWLLKEYYVGPIRETLAQTTYILEYFDKKSREVAGRYTYIPVHIGRNTAVQNVAEGVALPDGAAQKHDRMQIKQYFTYGVFAITGPAMAAMQNGGNASFVSGLQVEMDQLINDVRNHVNRLTIVGGPTKGFISEFKAGLGTSAGAVAGSVASKTWFNYDGDFTAFDNDDNTVDTTDNTTWVTVRLWDMSDYSEIVPSGGAAFTTASILCTGIDVAGGRIQLATHVDAGGGAGTLFTLSGITEPYAVALTVAVTEATDTTPWTAANASTTGVYDANNNRLEQDGIFENLASRYLQNSGTLDRNAAAYASLRSFIYAANGGGTATLRAAMTLSHLEEMDADIEDASDGGIDCYWMSRREKTKYFGLARDEGEFTLQPNGKADVGFNTVSHAGKMVKVDRHVPRGIVIHMSGSTWERTEMGEPGFQEMDGHVLDRTPADSYTGRYAWYWNLACSAPNANGITCGFSR